MTHRACVPQTLQQILDERARALVGRDRELTALLTLVDDGGPLVAVVHGIAGVGKSTLLRAFAGRARGPGASSSSSTQAPIEPTGAASSPRSARSTTTAWRRLEAGRRAPRGVGERVVLVVDTLERLRLLDDWLRLRLVPALPANVRVVLAGRDQPARPGRSRSATCCPPSPGQPPAADAEDAARGGVPEADSAA